MADMETNLQSSKKRAAGRELNRDRPELDDEDGASEQEGGTFKKASDDVLATRRIVKVRRNQGTSVPTSNPFAGIRLVHPAAQNPSEANKDVLWEKNGDVVECFTKKVIEEVPLRAPTGEIESFMDNGSKTDPEKVSVQETENNVENECVVGNTDSLKKPTETKAENDAGAGVRKSEDKAQDEGESNTNLTGAARSGFSTSTFSFGSVLEGDQPSFGFGLSTNGSSTMFALPRGEGSGITPMQDVVVETGEENERVVFNAADSVLFEFVDGSWKERGKGEVKVNISKSDDEKARILMRSRGNYRLVLNASLYPGMKLTNMDKKGVTFACTNGVSEAKGGGLSTFALKFKDASIMEEFRETVMAHKAKTAAALKTLENSPTGPDE